MSLFSLVNNSTRTAQPFAPASRLSGSRQIAFAAASLSLAASLFAVPLFGSTAHAAPQYAGSVIPLGDGTEVSAIDCAAPLWPNLPAMDFGRVLPGPLVGRATTFKAYAGGDVSAAVTDGSDIFQVGSITTYSVSKIRVPIDRYDMPPGYHGPLFTIETICTQDASVSGTGTVTAKPGEIVQVQVVAKLSPDVINGSGTLSVSLGSVTVQSPISLFVGGITASLDASSMHIPEGRSGDIPVTITNLGHTDTDATFNLYDAAPGVEVTNPTVHLPAGATVPDLLHVTVSRGADMGDYPYNLAVSAFGGSNEETIGLGAFTLTVDPLPVQSVTIPLGAVADGYNGLRDAACQKINDLTGQEVLSFTGRTLRDPNCYLAPLVLSAAQSGNTLTITGSAPGNWESFYATTPDGIPGALDPKFQVNYDLAFTLAVDLPQSLDGLSALRVRTANLTFQNTYIDSHNLTGDLVEAVAKAFGDGQYFRPADYALGDASNQINNTTNAALSQLDSVLQQAPTAGFSQIAFSLDPASLNLTVTLS